jgi:hypothetical protein
MVVSEPVRQPGRSTSASAAPASLGWVLGGLESQCGGEEFKTGCEVGWKLFSVLSVPRNPKQPCPASVTILLALALGKSEALCFFFFFWLSGV